MLRQFIFALLVSSAVSICLPASAQLVATKTLSNGPAPVVEFPPNPEDQVQLQRCNGSVSYSVADGVVVQKPSIEEMMRVEIVKVTPIPIVIGEQFSATVRIRNMGKAAIALPWDEDLARIAAVAPRLRDEGYGSAWVDFEVRAKVGSRQRIRLKVDGGLYAHSSLSSSSLTLQPGNWAELTVSGEVKCQLDNLCQGVKAAPKSFFSATWNEALRTVRRDGCSRISGYFVGRHVTSKSVKLEVLAKATATK